MAAPRSLTEIVVTERELRYLTAESLAALRDSNNPPRIFQHGEELVRVVEADQKARVQRMTTDQVVNELSLAANWRRAGEKKLKPVVPPRHLALDILAQRSWDFPALLAVVAGPVFSADGFLHSSPGYDPQTRCYLSLDTCLHLRTVSDAPTAAEVAEANRLILEELFVDFPFATQSDRAHAVALLLLPFLRPMIEGPTPLHLAEGPTAGTGKGLLVQVCLLPATGQVTTATPLDGSESERARQIVGLFRQGTQAVLFDNLAETGTLNSASLAAALTSDTFRARVTGTADMPAYPNRTIWTATANNPKLSTELVRRSVSIRLETEMQRPGERTGFKHQLPRWASEHRADLIWAACTLVNNWINQGRPAMTGPEPGSFQSYREVIGGVLHSAGIEGFLGNRDRMRERVDPTEAETEGFVAAWWAEFAGKRVGAAELHPIATECLDLGDGSEQSQKTALGNRLASIEEAVFDGWRIRADGQYQGAKRYRLEEVPGEPREPGEPSPPSSVEDGSSL